MEIYVVENYIYVQRTATGFSMKQNDTFQDENFGDMTQSLDRVVGESSGAADDAARPCQF